MLAMEREPTRTGASRSAPVNCSVEVHLQPSTSLDTPTASCLASHAATTDLEAQSSDRARRTHLSLVLSGVVTTPDEDYTDSDDDVRRDVALQIDR